MGPAEPDPFGDTPEGEPRTLRFRHGGLLVLLGVDGTVQRIMLTRPQAGSLAGVRAGAV